MIQTMAQSYKVRVVKNQTINGQHLSDDMVIHMQTKNGMSPLAYEDGKKEIVQRFNAMYGIDMQKAGVNAYNLKVEKE